MKHRPARLAVSLIVIAALAGCAGSAPPAAAGKPATVAELASYTGPDRQQILETGRARKGR